MKITGYRIQHTLRELRHAIDVAVGQFNDSLRVFPGETKRKPTTIMTNLRVAESKLARLQVVQARYNLLVDVKVYDTEMTLSEAVKLTGGVGRMEAMWRSVASPKKDRYSIRDEDTRDATAVVAVKTVTQEDATWYAKEAGRYASAIREAIQVGNATELDLETDPSLFE